jgi:hypothetical protein
VKERTGDLQEAKRDQKSSRSTIVLVFHGHCWNGAVHCGCDDCLKSMSKTFSPVS